MKEFVHDTILIGKEAHIFLMNEERKQRGCKPLSAEAHDRMWNRIPKYKETDMRQVDCETYGGGDGTYSGKWWSWSVDEIKTMLQTAGYKWYECEPIHGVKVIL